MNLTHIDENNRPYMVDVGDKDSTKRTATASGMILMNEAAFNAIKNNEVKKGPVLQTAVIGAIMGGKQTATLIPMCHNIVIDSIKCDIEMLEGKCGFKLYATASCSGKTGVEMEALMAASVGLLTIYDMVKAIDKGMEIRHIQLETKTGGKSGDYSRE